MKKNYIAPSCKEFQVRPVEMIAASLGVDNTGGNGDNGETDEIGGVKGEKSGAGIWDLY